MKLIRLAGVLLSLCVALLLTGCGDTFRPVVTPFPTPGGDPQVSRTAIVLNQGVLQPGSSTCVDGSQPPCQGSTTQIDVPGDTNTGNRSVGRLPWHAQIGTSAVTAFVVNRDSNTVSFYQPFTSGSTVTTISLPPGSDPVFVHSTESASVYVAESGTNKVGVITTGSSQLTSEVAVGNKPVALAETPDRSKLYVVNKNDGSVTVIAPLDKRILSPAGGLKVGTSPVWAIATPDSKFVFVLNRGSSTVSIISTANDQTELGQVPVGTSTDVNVPLDNPMYYDSKAKRLYVANSSDDTVSVFDANGLTTTPPTLPTQLKVIALPQGSQPISVAALSDGSRAYVGNGNGSVSIIDARALTLKTTLTVGTKVSSLAASPDGSKVYATVPDTITDQSGTVLQPAGTAVIRTSDDAVIVNNGSPITIPAPFQDPVNCVSDNPLTWAANTSYVLNTIVMPNPANGHLYKATTAGTSGASQPDFCTTSGCTVENDGTVKWTEIGSTMPACPRQSPVWVLTSLP